MISSLTQRKLVSKALHPLAWQLAYSSVEREGEIDIGAYYHTHPTTDNGIYYDESRKYPYAIWPLYAKMAFRYSQHLVLQRLPGTVLGSVLHEDGAVWIGLRHLRLPFLETSADRHGHAMRPKPELRFQVQKPYIPHIL